MSLKANNTQARQLTTPRINLTELKYMMMIIINKIMIMMGYK